MLVPNSLKIVVNYCKIFYLKFCPNRNKIYFHLFFIKNDSHQASLGFDSLFPFFILNSKIKNRRRILNRYYIMKYFFEKDKTKTKNLQIKIFFILKL